MSKTLVELCGHFLHENLSEIRSADSHSDLDAIRYCLAQTIKDYIQEELDKVPGGYVYAGACSTQRCFPLKEGGELRFSVVDGDVVEDITHDAGWECGFDHYDGKLLPGITGSVKRT